MRGTILGVHDGRGVLLGEGERRFEFPLTEWRPAGTPYAGQVVDYVEENGQARAVFAVPGFAGASFGAPQSGCGVTLLQQGMNIPRDISLVGFGNTLVSEHFRVPLTTIRQPKFRLGVAACDMLMQLIRGESVQSKRLPAELTIRESVASPVNR